MTPNHRPSPAYFRGRGRRGAAFIVALLVVTVLTGVVLVFARGMNTSADASRGAVSQNQARWVAQGALEAIRGELTEKIGLGEPPRLDTVGVQAEPLGGGYYWVIGRDTAANGSDGVVFDAGPEDVAFGLIGEAGKINVNRPLLTVDQPNTNSVLFLTAADLMAELPGMTPALAETLRNESLSLSLDDNNDALSAPRLFTTPDELRLISGFTAELFDGEDANRNGVLDPNEDDGDASLPIDNGDGRLDRGLRDFITVYSLDPELSSAGEERFEVDDDDDLDDLEDVLEEVYGDDRADELERAVGGDLDDVRFASVLELQQRTGMTEDEFELIHDRLSTDDDAIVGLVDVYHASPEVLETLPGLEPGDGRSIVDARPELAAGEAPGNLAWLADAVEQEKAAAVSAYLTHRSYQFSADVIAISGDGRAFCRLRYVLDAAPVLAGEAELPVVVHVQDLTSLGWPLDPAILEDLRRGVAAEDFVSSYGPTGL